jgi:hypothetical protein
VGQAQASDVVKWLCTSPPNETHRKATSACFLTNQLKITSRKISIPRLYNISQQNSRQSHALAMANEFKLSATLRGHEEDVSLSCDFPIPRFLEYHPSSMGFTAD